MAKQKTIQEKWAQDYNAVTILKPAPDKKKTVKKATKAKKSKK